MVSANRIVKWRNKEGKCVVAQGVVRGQLKAHRQPACTARLFAFSRIQKIAILELQVSRLIESFSIEVKAKFSMRSSC